jgi:hypothetical protein
MNITDYKSCNELYIGKIFDIYEYYCIIYECSTALKEGW